MIVLKNSESKNYGGSFEKDDQRKRANTVSDLLDPKV